MKKIIDDVLNNVSGLQLNLESKAARDMISNEIYNGIKKFLQIQLPILENQAVMENVEQDLFGEVAIDDSIKNAMEKAGYDIDSSGYDIQTGVRDMLFVDKNDKQVEITFKHK
jgi:hypothetical protein